MDDDPGAGGGGNPPEPNGGEPAGDPPATPALTLNDLKSLLDAQAKTLQTEFTKQLNGLDAKYQKQFKKEPAQPPQQQLTAEQLLAEKEREFNERLSAIETANAEKERQAQQKELDAEIKSALADFPWQTDSKGNSEGKDVAFNFYRSQAQRGEDGALTIGGMPLSAYIKEHATRAFKPYHAPRNVGGAGAAAGRGTVAPGLTADVLRDKAQRGIALTDDEKKSLRSELLETLRR